MENIVGSVSQQHLEVNPQIGLFSRPEKPIQFAHLCCIYSTAILVQVRGISIMGMKSTRLVTLKVEITRETATRLITFPAKGTMMVQKEGYRRDSFSRCQFNSIQHLRGLNADLMKLIASE